MPRPAELATIGDQAVRERAAEILARPQYARFRTLQAEWLGKLLELFNEWLAWITQLHARAPGLYFTLLLGMLALCALLITHLVWSLRAAMRMPAPAAAARGAGERDFAAEARSLAERGEFLEASHRLLLASLAHAARNRLVELKPDDGNRALCRKLEGAAIDPAMRARWIELIARTDALWFGARAQDAELYAAWRNVYGALTGSAP
jgi:hypothetical protein